MVANHPPAAIVAPMTPERRAQEAAFMRLVPPNQTPNDMTADVLAHVGEHVAYTCEVAEMTRPGVLVADCGSEQEGVDLYVKMPTERWHVGDKLRVYGILDTPASWSDAAGHTVYYPFIKAVYVDRVR